MYLHRRSIRKRWLILAVAAVLLAGTATAAVAATTPTAQGRPGVKEPVPGLTTATFNDPPAVVKPKYRWWMPVADETDAELQNELAQIAKTDGGGAEVTAFAAPNATGSNYHSTPQYLAQNGYGTPQWDHKVEVMEAAAKKDGLILDLAAGPRWPPTSPTISSFNAPQVAQQLIYGKEFDSAGATRTGALPTLTKSPPTVSRSLCAAINPGTTSVQLNSTQNITVGDTITLGASIDPETVTVTSVGTGASCTGLFAASAAGATNVSITALPTNIIAGNTVTIGAGASQESATVATVGTVAASTTTAAASTTGVTSLTLTSVTGINVGDTLTIGSGAGIETATVLATNTTTRTITTATALGSAHAAGEPVVDSGTGITFTTPLTNAHAAGDQIALHGATGVGVTKVTLAHAFGEPFVDAAKKELVAVEAAECTSACSQTTTGTIQLDQNSVIDVTKQVNTQGNLTYAFPTGNGNPWVLLDYYQTADGQAESGLTPTGSDYVLDHLSAAGADAIGDYWAKNVLSDPTVAKAIKQTSAQVGTPAIFEDSLELSNDLTWTSDFGTQFKKLRGYSIDLALPVLAGYTAGTKGTSPATAFSYSDSQGSRMLNDYQQTFSDLFSNRYITAMESWTEANNMTFRAQAYGDPVDAAQASENIGIPEGEGFEFSGHNPDQQFKVIAAGANASGASVVSSECCAMNGQVWATTAATNLTSEIYIGMAGGDTQVVWHGMPYLTAPAGSGSEAAWPGFSFGGNTSFSEAWGYRMPQWTDDKYLNEDIARMDLVLRQGTPQFDVGVYYQNLGLAGQGADNTNTIIPDTSAMSSAGYTYGYVDSALLTDPTKDYKHGVLFPNKSDYQALILNNQTTLKRSDADEILALAHAGLPVVIIGSTTTPTVGTPGYNTGKDDAAVQADVNALYALIGATGNTHVLQVATEADVPATLGSLGITPAAAHTSSPTSPSILDVRRTAGATNYYYLYNNSAQAVDQTLTLAGKGAPYALNTWTGAITPIGEYTGGNGSVTLQVHLAAHDAGVIALTPDKGLFSGKSSDIHVTSTTGDSAAYDPAGNLTIQARTGVYSTTLSNGKQVTSTVTGVPAASTLSQWSLTVDSWTPGPTDTPGDTAHTTIGPITVNADPTTGALPAWTAITPANGYSQNLQDVAGIGTYTTTVSLPSTWTGGRHAYLNLGTVTDTPEVSVNGHALPPVDFVDESHIDLGANLKAGANTITVTVASPLSNAVRVAPNTGASNRARTNNGMVGPVILTPYGQATVHTADN